MWRQGDVLIGRFHGTVPKKAKKTKPDAGRTVLAYGEVTGHAHAIPAPDAALYTIDGNTYLRVRKATKLSHEEHASIAMVKVVNSTPEPDGTYKDYFLRVPPTVKTAREAVAWTFGKEANPIEYAPELQT